MSKSQSEGVHQAVVIYVPDGKGRDVPNEGEEELDTSTIHGPNCITCCQDPDHRKLAICSILCGLSCLGILSLIYSVKARERRKAAHEPGEYSDKARKYGVWAILAWVAILVLTPPLIVLASYLITLKD